MACGYLLYLDTQVEQRFAGRIWQLPASVYARPLELYAGKLLTANAFLHELKLLNYTPVEHLPAKAGQYHHWQNIVEVKTRAFDFYDGHETGVNLRLSFDGDRVTELVDSYSGATLDLVRFDPAYLTGIFPVHGEDRVLLKIEDVPDDFIKMLVLVEDRRFFEHYGVDPRAIARALVANIKAGHTVQGGSTITQQLVKNLFLSPSQTLWRKLNEALMALLLELHHDKRKILETYINEVYLGQDQERAIHGFGLASQYYFGKRLLQLTLDEKALLVGMVKGASYYHPQRNPERAQERRAVVLDIMAENGLITSAQAKKLAQRKLDITHHARRSRYPAFIDLVKRQLREFYAADDLRSAGLRIFTTLDPDVQRVTEQALDKTLAQIDHKQLGMQGAAVVVSPDNGDVLALVGDRQPSYDGFNRALDARRQIGSLIKPVIYLAALQHTQQYTLASVLDDSPLRVMGDDKKLWEPQNYDKTFHGDVLLFDALLNSYNIPAVRTGLDIGLADIARTMRALGVERELPPYPATTLGAVTLSPLEVAAIYQTFSAHGFHSPLRSVIAVLDQSGTALSRFPVEVKRGVDADAITLVNYALQHITQQGTAQRLANELNLSVAGKTGTTNDLRDSWFAGFSADKVAVVWVGNDDNQPAGITGASAAMRVWSGIMQQVARVAYQPRFSANISLHWIDRASGQLSGQSCENAIELPFISGTEPTATSPCAARTPIDWIRGIFDH